MTRRYSLTLDLKNDPALIAEYKRCHERMWPEIPEPIQSAGIEYLVDNPQIHDKGRFQPARRGGIRPQRRCTCTWPPESNPEGGTRG